MQHCHSSLIESLIGQGNHMTNQEKILHSYYTTAVKIFIVVVVCRSWACPQCMSLSCVHLNSLGEVGRGHVHVVSFSRAGSVPGVRVDWAAALHMLESLHACMRSRVTLCHRGCGVRTF